MSQVERLEKDIDQIALGTAYIAFFEIHNMCCSHCATWVRNGLLKLDGVILVDVFFKQGIAAATYDPLRVTLSDLEEAIKSAGTDICHYYWAEFIGHSRSISICNLGQSAKTM